MRIAILGAGKIGEALLAGLLGSGVAADDLCFTEQYSDRADALTARYGVAAVKSVEAAASADLVVLAVKPADIGSLAAEIAAALSPATLVVSVAAGITTAYLEQHLSPGAHVVRVMPNTPMLVGEGMSAIAAGKSATDADLAAAEEILGAVGKVVRLPESQLDAVTALSGSGPAYVFLLAEAMVDAGVLIRATPPRGTAARCPDDPRVRLDAAATAGIPRRFYARRSPHPEAPPLLRCANSKTTVCGRPSTPLWKPRATDPRNWQANNDHLHTGPGLCRDRLV